MLTWIVPDTYTEDTAVPFNFTATNSIGSSNATLSVNVVTDTAPVWSADAITITTTEGDVDDQYDFAPNLTGSPTPTLSLDVSASDIPANLSFSGTVLHITPTSNFVKSMRFQFGVVASNGIADSKGNISQTKSVTLNIIPIFTDGEEIVFSSNDFEEIRKLVDSKLGISDLPDVVIDTDSVIGAAIAWGLNTMPIQEFTRTLDELKAKRRAIIYRAAGILAVSVRQNVDPTFLTPGIAEQQLQNTLFAESDLQRQIANRDLTDPEDTILDSIFIIVPRG